MFGFLKTQPAPQPAGFAGEVLIEKSVEEVYALLDWADQHNAERQRGNLVASVEDQPGSFRMQVPALPRHRFDIAVTEAVPNHSYGFKIEISPMIGRRRRRTSFIRWSHWVPIHAAFGS